MWDDLFLRNNYHQICICRLSFAAVNKMTSDNNSNNYTRPRSHSPGPPHKRSRNRRRLSLPSKFHHTAIYHPYFSHHNYIMTDDSIDTSSSNRGIVFYQNPSSGEVDFYWDYESEICSPSLMPEMLTFDEISGDSTDNDEKYFKIMAQELSKRAENNAFTQNERQIHEGNDESAKNMDVDNGQDDVDDMIREMSELLSDKNQELKEREEDPPSPTSPRDPEREGPVLSEEEEDTEQGAVYRLEHDPEFQDEAGLMYGEGLEGKVNPVNPDDEGMDPMENM